MPRRGGNLLAARHRRGVALDPFLLDSRESITDRFRCIIKRVSIALNVD
jgi:hypothetical protein